MPCKYVSEVKSNCIRTLILRVRILIRDSYVCPSYLLFCPMCKDSCQMCKDFIVSELILNVTRPEDPVGDMNCSCSDLAAGP